MSSRRTGSRSSKRRSISTQEKEDPDEEEEVGPVVIRRRRIAATQDNNDEDEEEEEDQQRGGASQGDFCFSQQNPEFSQTVLPERANERRNLDYMDRDARDKALASLSRLILFKALDHEPIDRVKTIKDAGLSGGPNKISTAAYQEVASRFQNVFGFEIKQTPQFMQKYKTLPQRFKERYYVVNTVQDTDDGAHSRAIHSVLKTSKIEKGVLILTVALIFCKGENRADGSRHLLARELYRLMHAVDENIPEEPPAQGTARAKTAAGTNNGNHKLQGSANSCTPNLDVMLEHFCHADYLIKEKATEENFHSMPMEEGDVLYSMGPRAALELGRKQIITFCAEILNEEPDPSMLREIEDDANEEENGGVLAASSQDDVYMEAAAAH